MGIGSMALSILPFGVRGRRGMEMKNSGIMKEVRYCMRRPRRFLKEQPASGTI